VEDVTIDYSQPIVLATSPGESSYPTSQTEDAAADEQAAASDPVTQQLDAARNAFLEGDYRGALAQCDQALAKRPNDTIIHEFRGLVLFALGRYQEAAGTVYAVLSIGPGWDWTTLSGFYSDIDVYTQQLRALEKYVNENVNAADARFLLAYHYMTCGHNDAAAAQFKAAVKLNPKDQLSAQLLAALTTTEAPKPAAPAASEKPVEAAALVGDWKADRPDGGVIALKLSKDGKYTWTFTQKGKSQEFSGDYSVADNLLILKKDNNPVMVGQVAMTSDKGFNFKMPGENPADPGLAFGK
jgi:tetratricopeptide (TPR) repeat protein